MLIRLGIAIKNKEYENDLILKLTGISIVLKIEFDIAIYSNDFNILVKNIENIDIIIVDFEILEKNKDNVSEIYKKNTKCLPILIGKTIDKIYDYLIIRPIAHINTIESINPEGQNDKLKNICNLFIYLANKAFEEKTDNSVLYVTTRQGSYAIAKDNILYCQSDLKYTIFVLDNGNYIRKLDKLQDIEEKYLWDFKRVHQSFLINPKKVISLDKIKNEVILEKNLRVPFSRKYSDDVRKLFKN